MFRFPLTLLLVYDLLGFIILDDMLGPADMVFKRVEHCDPECKVVDFWIEQRKFNRSVEVLDITLNTPYDINEMVTVELKGSMKKEGGFKPGSFYYKDNVCKAMDKMLGDVFYQILNKFGLDACPLPKDEYKVESFFFDNEKFTVPQLWGEYKMEAFISKDEELQGCYVVYYDMVKKQEEQEEEEE